LNIQSTEIINKVEIYSTGGQLITTIKSPVSSIDISSLAKGTYIIRSYTKEKVEFCMVIKK